MRLQALKAQDATRLKFDTQNLDPICVLVLCTGQTSKACKFSKLSLRQEKLHALVLSRGRRLHRPNALYFLKQFARTFRLLCWRLYLDPALLSASIFPPRLDPKLRADFMLLKEA
jgi:hypothetical protein